MINKKISKVLGSILGIVGFMFAIGVFEVPALADDNVQANYASTNTTTSSAVTYKDYSISVNKSAEQNGIKVTIDKIIATKHKIKVIVKVESEKTFDKSKDDHSIIQVTYGENNDNGGSSSNEYIDDKTMLLTIEQECDEQEYPEKGELRVDVVFPRNKVNIGIDVLVDFSESFKNTFEKDISVKIPNFNFTLNKLEANNMGTRLTYSKIEKDDSERENAFSQLHHSSIILKAGDKMYKEISSGSSSSRNEKNERIVTGTYESEAATYDKINNQKVISIIPVVCDITFKEMQKIYEDNYKNGLYKEININDETINNVNYKKYFEFSNGSKGEIYNIERNDNSIKVYCKGNSDKESLLMASNININYKFIEGKSTQDFYDDNHISFYKDSNQALGYIVEFNNVDKDKAIEVYLDDFIKQVDRYTVGDEIQL